MQQYGSKYFARSPPFPSEGQHSTFSEHVHVAHQRNREGSNMVATANRGTINMNISNMILDRRPVPDPLGGLRWWDQNVKIHFF